MARANRLGGQGGVFHVTHRCHNRAFLLKFARDRDAYRTKLHQKLRLFNISLLDYCLTSNHVHLLVDTADRLELGGFMREVASESACAYNRRKGRMNAFWGDNYHATLVEPGDYLWRCLCYIELNMVRCGVVTHPQHWQWVGYHDILGTRQRNRLVDLERLCWRLGAGSLDEVGRNLIASLADRIERGDAKREPCWTESLAVGSMGFVQRMQPLILSRVETGIVEAAEDVWTLQEAVVAYGQK
ncbi:MAG: transposase [Verrucomicrobia bacterium]|nr:transposase [Verrucomicrobiota bacterium]